MEKLILTIILSFLCFGELVEYFPNGIHKYDFSAEHKKIAFIDSLNHFYLYDLELEELETDFQLDSEYEYRNYDFESGIICMQKGHHFDQSYIKLINSNQILVLDDELTWDLYKGSLTLPGVSSELECNYNYYNDISAFVNYSMVDYTGPGELWYAHFHELLLIDEERKVKHNLKLGIDKKNSNICYYKNQYIFLNGEKLIVFGDSLELFDIDLTDFYNNSEIKLSNNNIVIHYWYDHNNQISNHNYFIFNLNSKKIILDKKIENQTNSLNYFSGTLINTENGFLNLYENNQNKVPDLRTEIGITGQIELDSTNIYIINNYEIHKLKIADFIQNNFAHNIFPNIVYQNQAVNFEYLGTKDFTFNYGDDIITNNPSSTYSYSNSGTYYPTLLVNGEQMNTQPVVVIDSLNADFSVSSTYGRVGEEIIINDNSTGQITTRNWIGSGTFNQINEKTWSFVPSQNMIQKIELKVDDFLSQKSQSKTLDITSQIIPELNFEENYQRLIPKLLIDTSFFYPQNCSYPSLIVRNQNIFSSYRYFWVTIERDQEGARSIPHTKILEINQNGVNCYNTYSLSAPHLPFDEFRFTFKSNLLLNNYVNNFDFYGDANLLRFYESEGKLTYIAKDDSSYYIFNKSFEDDEVDFLNKSEKFTINFLNDENILLSHEGRNEFKSSLDFENIIIQNSIDYYPHSALMFNDDKLILFSPYYGYIFFGKYVFSTLKFWSTNSSLNNFVEDLNFQPMNFGYHDNLIFIVGSIDNKQAFIMINDKIVKLLRTEREGIFNEIKIDGNKAFLVGLVKSSEGIPDYSLISFDISELDKLETIGTIDVSSFSDEDNAGILYPNPANKVINIDPKVNIKSLEMISISGETIDVDYNNNIININGLSAGIYIISMENMEGQIYREKVIIN